MPQTTSQITHDVVQEILRALDQLRYGSVEITVHEGRITQIERREKVRFNQTSVQETARIQPTAKAAAI
ncbi:MAG TPA: YezD family protein [Methylophilaceae bacterium]|nr:YezD family protein [Methylophilaceae bacterium]